MKLRSIIRACVTKLVSHSVLDYVKEFSETDHFSSAQIEVYQMRKLNSLLDFAYHHVPYYHNLFDSLRLKPGDFHSTEDLKKLPILTKEIVRKEGRNMFPDVSLDGVKIASTSGSSGDPIVLRKTRKAREIEQALMYRYKKNAGVDPNGCALIIWGGHSFSYIGGVINNIKHWLLNEQFYDTYHMNDDMVSEIIATLNTGKITYLRGYTSAVYYVAQQILSRGLHYEIPFVSVSAEKLLDSQRAIIEEAFGHNLYDQYGCGECGAIAYECKEHNGLHHNFEHSILEVVDNNGLPTHSGRVLLTNLDNYAMPLIRYENGDMVTLNEKSCICERQSLLIKKVEGRTYDIFYGENGKVVHAGFLDDVLLDVNLLSKYHIQQLQIIQKEPLVFVCKYISQISISEDDRLELEKTYRKHLGEHIQLHLQHVDSLYVPKSGKRHFVVPFNKYLENPSLYD